MAEVNYENFHNTKVQDYDCVIVGSGFAGAVVARQLANAGKNILIIEKRDHIGGNMYDFYDDAGILIHKYGPHIFHTSSKKAADFVKKYSEVIPYEHRVKASVGDMLIPVPFNKTSAEMVFGAERANEIIHKLVKKFGNEVKITINQLRQQDDPDLIELADYVYENVFLHYTEKQWGLKPEEVDPTVTARVPIFISRDDRYFQDSYQFMPKYGYTKLFENILSHENITVALNTEAESVFGLIFEGPKEDDGLEKITIQYLNYNKPIVFTGPLDELFLWRFGRLPYRSLDFVSETLDKEYEFPCGTVNFTVSEDYTRITEYKHLTRQISDKTTIMKEYSKAYVDVRKQIPYYAIINEENNAHYQKYKNLIDSMPNFYAIGRLAEYKYYNMDQIIDKAIDLAEEIIRK